MKVAGFLRQAPESHGCLILEFSTTRKIPENHQNKPQKVKCSWCYREGKSEKCWIYSMDLSL